MEPMTPCVSSKFSIQLGKLMFYQLTAGRDFTYRAKTCRRLQVSKRYVKNKPPRGVPVTEIADWSWRSLQTHDGDPVPSESSSMGDVKSMYR